MVSYKPYDLWSNQNISSNSELIRYFKFLVINTEGDSGYFLHFQLLTQLSYGTFIDITCFNFKNINIQQQNP